MLHMNASLELTNLALQSIALGDEGLQGVAIGRGRKSFDASATIAISSFTP
jgi:hypothetical protein